MRLRQFVSVFLVLLVAWATSVGMAAPTQMAMGGAGMTAMACCPERTQAAGAPTCAQLCQGVIPQGWAPSLTTQAILIGFPAAVANREGLRGGPEPPPPRSV